VSLFEGREWIEIDPNPPCILCDKPIFSRSDNMGFVVADLACCVDCYDAPPAWPDTDD
jgi:hypothetical protein